MTTYYARIRINEEDFNRREKSIELDCIFGKVFAPKSKIIIEHIQEDIVYEGIGTDVSHQMTILVPCWVFWKNQMNPCQLCTGYVEQIKM